MRDGGLTARSPIEVWETYLYPAPVAQYRSSNVVDMKCQKCRNENPEDDLICGGCGASLSGMNTWVKGFIWVMMVGATVGLLVPSCYGLF